MLTSQTKAHAQVKRHAIEIFFNRIKTGFSEFFEDAFQDNSSLQSEPDLLTQAGDLIVGSVPNNDESPSDNTSFNYNAPATA